MSSPLAKVRYRATHGGLPGRWDEKRLEAPDPRAGELVCLGELVSVVYLTEKAGDDGLTEYEHKFSRPRPVLTFHTGGLVICGGKYRVGPGGIHG